MQCTDLQPRLAAYVAGRLPEPEIDALDEHLEACPDCSEALNAHLAGLASPDRDASDAEMLRLARLPPVSDEESAAGIAAILDQVSLRREGRAGRPAADAQPAPRRTRDWWGPLPGWAPGFATAAAAVTLFSIVAWNLYHQGQRRVQAAESRVGLLRAEIADLRRRLDEATSTRPQQPSDDDRAELARRIETLQTENERIRQQLASLQPADGRTIVLWDGGRVLAVGPDGSVLVRSENPLPDPIARSVRALVWNGFVPAADRIGSALAALRIETTHSVLRGAEAAENPLPVPIDPVSTGVISPDIRLRWRAVEGAKRYQVRLAFPEDREEGRVVWEADAGPRTEISVLAGTLRRGQSYFWQVEAVIGEDTRVSPPAGIWVVDPATAREADDISRRYPKAPLVLAATFEALGLYAEAEKQLERVAAANPASPPVQRMLERLRRRRGEPPR